MINTTKLRVLADAIESAPEQTFDMQSWFTHVVSDDSDVQEGVLPVWGESFVAGGINPHCGTAGCIAGWTCNIFLPPGTEVHEDFVHTTALKLLGAEGGKREGDADILSNMFTSANWWSRRRHEGVWGLSDVTPEMAAEELRKLADELDGVAADVEAAQ
jgi:hypothetical protein